mgnify:CR=1 FL=1
MRQYTFKCVWANNIFFCPKMYQFASAILHVLLLLFLLAAVIFLLKNMPAVLSWCDVDKSCTISHVDSGGSSSDRSDEYSSPCGGRQPRQWRARAVQLVRAGAIRSGPRVRLVAQQPTERQPRAQWQTSRPAPPSGHMQRSRGGFMAICRRINDARRARGPAL